MEAEIAPQGSKVAVLAVFMEVEQVRKTCFGRAAERWFDDFEGPRQG